MKLEPSRYGRGHYTLNGVPYVHTDGYILTVRGADSLIAARELFGQLVQVHDPTARPLPRVEGLRNAIAGLYDPIDYERIITARMPADQVCVDEMTARHVAQCDFLHDKLKAIDALSLKDRAKDLRRTVFRDALVVEERNHANKAHAGYHGLRVGLATIDGRLLSRAFRWLGATKGRLRAHTDLHLPLVLYTDQGLATIMPVR